METNPFLGTKEPATPADIAAIEAEYGFTLPADYKAHILQYNGGWPTRTAFMQPDPDLEGHFIVRDVSDFKSIRYGTSTLERSLRRLRGELHHDLIPFASEGGGDLFCLSVGPEDYSSVYYISHEFYKPPKRKEMSQPRQYGKGVTFLAPSFTTFLNELVEVPDED